LIKNSTYAEDFRAYLEKYPSGQFASLAKNRISSLDASTRRVESKPVSNDVSPTELAFWDSIKNSPDPEDFKSYLDEYPNGQFVALARNNLRRLETGKTENKSATNTNSTGVNVGPPKTPPKPGALVKNQMGIEMVYIPPGEFMMGSENGDKDERPVHRVTISQAFYIGRYEVTQAQWQAAMGDNPSHFKDCGGNCPVERVSWKDAQNFINKLNESNDGFRYRLPTEAEWEYACRAGTTGDYAGTLSEMAWYGKNSGSKTHAVGGKQPNAWGLADMHGNVWEWCQDWYHKTYYGAPTDGSAWLSGGEQEYRVLRGRFVGQLCRGLALGCSRLRRPGLSRQLQRVSGYCSSLRTLSRLLFCHFAFCTLRRTK
jgi:formylglycine-generating enzyme required for sulfatase activity